MSEQKDARFVTVAQAKKLLPKGKQVHTYRAGGFMLIGADWRKKALFETMENCSKTLQLAGETARGRGHGLVLCDEHGPLFIETDAEKLDAFDPQNAGDTKQ